MKDIINKVARKLKKLIKYRNLMLMIMDMLCIAVAYILGTLLITGSSSEFFSEYYVKRTLTIIAVSIVVYQIVFGLSGQYKHIIRYEDAKDYLMYMVLSIVSSGIIAFFRELIFIGLVSTRLIILASIFIGFLMVSYRVAIRYILVSDVAGRGFSVDKKDQKNLLIIGAGNAAHDIIKTIHHVMPEQYNIIGIIDDNPRRQGYSLSGVKIIGNRNDIVEICKTKNVDTIFFSIANIDSDNKKQILGICQETNAKVRVLPGVKELIKNKNIMDNLRDVELEDLLGRDPVKLDNKNIESLIKDNCVLVTGAGGSIGSELCRQIVKYKPSRLVMLDIYENSLYDIQMEFQRKNIKANIVTIIASIRDKKRLEEIFEEYKPALVFHAAAHKHVPLMEGNPLEAIKNNIFGTYNVVNACDDFGVKKFILISTDKAVNPTNIMGATKRMCEMIVQAKSKNSKTEFAAVRFGNVLGSNGSVVPLFKKQIAKGGPLTITHKEITRFFMTIPEAVGLVLQAMSYAKGGEIFVLDMGQPVKIYDLAVSLIKLSGLEPNVDIPIKVTGLRPGEKLYEELLMEEEGLKNTEHKKIFIGKPSSITEIELEQKLEQMKELVQNEEVSLNKIKQTMHQVVPTYNEPEQDKQKSKIKIAAQKVTKIYKETEKQTATV